MLRNYGTNNHKYVNIHHNVHHDYNVNVNVNVNLDYNNEYEHDNVNVNDDNVNVNDDNDNVNLDYNNEYEHDNDNVDDNVNDPVGWKGGIRTASLVERVPSSRAPSGTIPLLNNYVIL